jgi:ABC-2 type transport system permease protein
MASNLLGGVLYPVAVLPTPLLWLSALLPITHSANALRFGLLAGHPQASLHETAILALLSALYLGVGVGVARVGFGISRQRGTLGQY